MCRQPQALSEIKWSSGRTRLLCTGKVEKAWWSSGRPKYYMRFSDIGLTKLESSWYRRPRGEVEYDITGFPPLEVEALRRDWWHIVTYPIGS